MSIDNGFKINRRRLLQTAAATGGLVAMHGVAGGLLSRPARAAGHELSTMRSTAKSWLWAAEDYGRDGGFFEQAGVKVASNASGRGVNVAALIGGEVDIVLGSPDSAILAAAQGQPLKIFAGMVNKYASHVVIKKDILDKAGVTESSPVEAKAAVLKGLKLGTTGPGAAPDNLFRFLLSKANLDPDRDTQLVGIQGGGQALLASMERGVIDGFCLSSPTSDIAVSKFGAAYLFNMATNPPPELANYLYITAYTTEKTIAEKRAALVNYCKGLALTLRSIQSDRAAFRGWAETWFEGLEPTIFGPAFDTNSRIFMDTPMPSAAQFELNRQFVNRGAATRGQPGLPDSMTFEKAYDPSIAQEALASL